MTASNSDLLPPIFDQVVPYFGDREVGPKAREDIVNALIKTIINAAVDNVKEMLQTPNGNGYEERYPDLRTSDRLSGTSLSRARLVEEIQMIMPLSPPTLETALILIESQIDLRLKRVEGFEVSGIRFSLDNGVKEARDVASWCQGILPSILQGMASDRSTIWSRLARHRPERIRILVEGLQLAATLREAVPYRIKVREFLIDPFVKGSTEKCRIRMLHISDLHMVEEITEPGRRLLRPFGAITHKSEAADSLSRKLRDLKPRYDLVLATGDLTTNGAQAAFKTVKKYIQDEKLYGKNPMRIAMFGLSSGARGRLVIPGNHDRYGDKLIAGQRMNTLFEEMFETPQHYPYVVGYRPPGRRKDKNSLTLLFFAFDSNLPEVPKGRPDKAIARGKINPAELEEAIALAKEITQVKKVKDFYGETLEFNPRKTVRIAVLHHHPFVTEKAEKDAEENRGSLSRLFKTIERSWQGIMSNLTRMENAEEFLEKCFSMGVQLVLFGHEHAFYYRSKQRPPPVSGPGVVNDDSTPFGNKPPAIHGFCCPSAMESRGLVHGFYVFDFFDEQEVAVDFYRSKRDDKDHSLLFIRDPENCRIINLSNASVMSKNAPREIIGSGLQS